MNIQSHIKFSKTIIGIFAIISIVFGVYFSSNFITKNTVTGFTEIKLSPILLTLFLHSLIAYLFFKAKQHFSFHKKTSLFYSYSAILLSTIIFFPIGIYLLLIQLKSKR